MSTTLISLCWCNNCSKLVTLETGPQHYLSSCPNCNGGSIDKITREQLSPSFLRARWDFSVPNPRIYIRRPTSNQNTLGSGFDCYYDDGEGSGFTRLQSGLSESLLEAVDLLFRFANIFLRPRFDEPRKAAIALMPTIEIQECHVSSNPHCAVCLEPFGLETKAKEMAVCKHIYHSDCILPWLASHDSCPLCRHQLSSDEEEVVGLVLWRLPGDMVAYGRFSGGERPFRVMVTNAPIIRDGFGDQFLRVWRLVQMAVQGGLLFMIVRRLTEGLILGSF